MKWLVKKETPKHGDERCVARFAWIPVQIDEYYKVWLEYYLSTEEFIKPRYSDSPGWWVSIKKNFYYTYD